MEDTFSFMLPRSSLPSQWRTEYLSFVLLIVRARTACLGNIGNQTSQIQEIGRPYTFKFMTIYLATAPESEFYPKVLKNKIIRAVVPGQVFLDVMKSSHMKSESLV